MHNLSIESELGFGQLDVHRVDNPFEKRYQINPNTHYQKDSC